MLLFYFRIMFDGKNRKSLEMAEVKLQQSANMLENQVQLLSVSAEFRKSQFYYYRSLVWHGDCSWYLLDLADKLKRGTSMMQLY